MAVLRKRGKSKWRDFDLQFVIKWIKILLFDPSKTWVVGLGLLLAEIVVNVLVIWKIKCEYRLIIYCNVFFGFFYFVQIGLTVF